AATPIAARRVAVVAHLAGVDVAVAAQRADTHAVHARADAAGERARCTVAEAVARRDLLGQRAAPARSAHLVERAPDATAVIRGLVETPREHEHACELGPAHFDTR